MKFFTSPVVMVNTCTQWILGVYDQPRGSQMWKKRTWHATLRRKWEYGVSYYNITRTSVLIFHRNLQRSAENYLCLQPCSKGSVAVLTSFTSFSRLADILGVGKNAIILYLLPAHWDIKRNELVNHFLYGHIEMVLFQYLNR